jgi:hypothetical protein
MLSTLLLATLLAGAEAPGSLTVEIFEKDPAGKESPVPARVHLTGPDGNAVKPAAQPSGLPRVLGPPLPFFQDHWSTPGKLSLELSPGTYAVLVERGPEYRRASGKIEVPPGGKPSARVVLERWVRLSARGWWCGDTHVHRPIEELPLILDAEDLNVAPAITDWNKSNPWKARPLPEKLLVEPSPGRAIHLLACEDERKGGALLYFNVSAPLDFASDGPEYPSSVQHLMEAVEKQGAWAEIEKPFWWDVPAWVATGKVRSIGIANNHMCRAGVYASEAWGRPRDVSRLPAPRGNGFYTQEIYYALLNCGFRIPPTAGSASGVLPNPVGYNRVYVHLDGPFSHDAWWKGLEAGRSFVTNGPVLLVEANGRLPGHVFKQEEGSGTGLEVSLDIRVEGNDPLEAVEVIRDGEIVESFPKDQIKSARLDTVLRPKPLVFSRSGWFLVRAIADVPETFRFASTAPFFVEAGSSPRTVHRKDVESFLRWIDERIDALMRSTDLPDPEKREAVLAPHRLARKEFEKLLESAVP